MNTKSWDKTWEKIYRSREWGKYPPEELVRFIARNYYKTKDRKSVKILDVGCGTGAATWFIAREGFTAYGIDGSPTAIKIAKKRFAAEKLKGHFQVGDIISLPFKDGEFNAVTDIAAIQHNTPPHIKKIVAEVHRILKPGGKFFAMLWAENKGWTETTDLTSHFFSRTEIKQLLKDFTALAIEEVVREKDWGARLKFFAVQAIK